MHRVAVFLDYQNVYRSARRAFFGDSGPASHGNVFPDLLADLFVSRGFPGGELVAVHVYRGLADATKQPKTNAAALRQQAAHEARAPGIVRYHHRPLRYPYDWPNTKPEEKGVDVELAMDFVTMAGRDYDVGVLFSADTDLLPALEAVTAMTKPYPRCTVATWVGGQQIAPRLRLPQVNLYCYYLDRADFDSVADTTRYAVGTSASTP